MRFLVISHSRVIDSVLWGGGGGLGMIGTVPTVVPRLCLCASVLLRHVRLCVCDYVCVHANVHMHFYGSVQVAPCVCL